MAEKFVNHATASLWETGSAEPAPSGLSPGRQTVPNRVCEQCRRPFYFRRANRPTSVNPGKFCSQECSNESRRGVVPGASKSFITPESDKAQRVRANGLINKRLRLGWFSKPAMCMCCRVQPTRDSHHVDYAKPDEVHWLCRSCHMKAHQRPEILDGIPPFLAIDQRKRGAA